MIIADVNVLVYAYRQEAEDNEAYATWLADTLGGGEDFGLLDTVLSGFVRIVTNSRIFAEPAPMAHALTFVERLFEGPRGRWVATNQATWRILADWATADRHLRGNMVPDAYIAAVASANNARVATTDSGFARFPKVRWFDPIR